MKYRDIFIQILSETSGRPKEHVAELLRLAVVAKPEMDQGFDRELSEDEAQKLLSALRDEKAGIAAWLVRGAMEVNSAAPKTDKKQ